MLKPLIFKRSAFFVAIFALAFSAQGLAGWDGGTHADNEQEEAMKLEPDLDNGKAIFNDNCTHCHREDGIGYHKRIGRIPGNLPQLAGQHRNVLIKQLVDIRSGNRDNPAMYPFTLDRFIGGPQEVADVTAYITTLAINEDNQVGMGNDLEHGKALYDEHCSKCHGDNGEGDNDELYPRLQGQNYTYMLRQFEWIRDGRRRNANEKMQEQIASFTYRDMKAVIDYTSRLKPKK